MNTTDTGKLYNYTNPADIIASNQTLSGSASNKGQLDSRNEQKESSSPVCEIFCPARSAVISGAKYVGSVASSFASYVYSGSMFSDIYYYSPNLEEIKKSAQIMGFFHMFFKSQITKLSDEFGNDSLSILRDIFKLGQITILAYHGTEVGHSGLHYNAFSVASSATKVVCKVGVMGTMAYTGFAGWAGLASNMICEPIADFIKIRGEISEQEQKPISFGAVFDWSSYKDILDWKTIETIVLRSATKNVLSAFGNFLFSGPQKVLDNVALKFQRYFAFPEVKDWRDGVNDIYKSMFPEVDGWRDGVKYLYRSADYADFVAFITDLSYFSLFFHTSLFLKEEIKSFVLMTLGNIGLRGVPSWLKECHARDAKFYAKADVTMAESSMVKQHLETFANDQSDYYSGDFCNTEESCGTSNFLFNIDGYHHIAA